MPFALFSLAVLALVLCIAPKAETDGPDAQGYRWERNGYGPTGEPQIHRNVDVFLQCGLEPHAKSCARIEAGRCDVYLPLRPEPWQEAHELRHCDGWVHPGGLGW